MNEIFLPQKITYGENSLSRLSPQKYSSPLIVSDYTETGREYIDSTVKTLSKIISYPHIVVKKNMTELIENATDVICGNDVDLIIAVGSAQVMDAAALLSYRTGSDYIAVPESALTAMTDFDDISYFQYRKNSVEIILEPELIYAVPAEKLALDAMACFAYAVDALVLCDSRLVYRFALSSAQSILNNVVSAFRGEISAREKLMLAMCVAVTANENVKGESASVLNKVASFFAQFGYSKQLVSAMCIPNIMEEYYSDAYSKIYKGVVNDKAEHSDEKYAELLTEHIRRILASLGIQRSIKTLGASEEEFRAFSENSKLPQKLLDLCYYGSFKFIRM